jgi:hypothetical protein
MPDFTSDDIDIEVYEFVRMLALPRDIKELIKELVDGGTSS